MSATSINMAATASGRLFKRLGMTLIAGTVLTGFYSVYAMILRPVVETPGIGRPMVHNDTIWAPQRPRQGVEMAERYLASQPWAAQAKYILRTEEAYVYFEEWESLDEDEAARFTPFAMIYASNGPEPDKEPITIISDSAYVRFAKKFRITSPDPGRVIGGALEGQVYIRGDNGMRVVGRNFLFQEQAMRLWSDDQVGFAYGPHKGNGHGLQIELIPDPEARAKEKLAVKGFKTIRLRRNVSMDLEFQNGEAGSLTAQANTAQTNDPPQPADPPKKPEEPTIVNVRSAGSFEFVIATNVATFEDKVRVYHPTEPGKYNSLESDLLTLYFEPKPKAGNGQAPEAAATKIQPAPPKTDEFQSVESNLTFRRLMAQGGNVILRSETNDLIAMMHRLDYDAKTRLAKMTSRKIVVVRQKQSYMQAPTIELVNQEHGRVSHFAAKGPGSLKSVDPKTNKLTFAAEWKKELRKQPDPQNGLDMIDLVSEAQVWQPEDQFGLAADSIRLWLKPEDDSRSAPAGPRQFAGEEDDRSNRMQPKKLVARNNVAIVTPEMQGQTHRLEVWFEPGPAPLPSADAKRSRRSLQPAIKQIPQQQQQPETLSAGNSQVAASSTGYSTGNVPFAPPASEEAPPSSTRTGSNGTDSSEDKQKSEDGPIELVSDLIEVKVLTYQGEKQSEVSEVRATGNVLIKQRHAPEELPLKMTGDKLDVKNRSEHDQELKLRGSPAHVWDRGMHIEGREIVLDRQKNFAEVNGAGLLQLPVTRSLDGEELNESRPLNIWWEEQMTFDGLDAKFFGNVRAVLNNEGVRSNMRCEEMNVVLTRRISFTESQSSRGTDQIKAEIARVFCKDGVEFDSYKYEESKLTEIRRGDFAEFAINQTTGETFGQGPGCIELWRRGRGKRASLTPNATVKANRALKPDASNWEYMRIDFAGTADGNLKQKFNTFQVDVQIVYGPVERPLMVIKKLEDLPKDAGWMRSQSLRITQHEASAAEESGHVDLLALGNVTLEGQSFHARADSISYDESKGLYTLRSQGRQKATIWRQTQIGGDPSRADAQMMNFIPARNILKLDQVISLEGVN